MAAAQFFIVEANPEGRAVVVTINLLSPDFLMIEVSKSANFSLPHAYRHF
jgi:hypothetical protein